MTRPDTPTTESRAPGDSRACGVGSLFVVATPIGNLEDISARACAVLSMVDLVLAEDTRRTRVLLAHHGIATRAKAFHDHNETREIDGVLERLRRGENLALVSDAGTPLVSDPGFELVRCLRGCGIQVVPVPGPSAVSCALSVASLPVDRFVFEGFLPARTTSRRKRLADLSREPRTILFYEAPHRVLAALGDMSREFGGTRPAMLAKELTKLHESVQAGTLDELMAWLVDDERRQRGEFVLMVGGAHDEPSGAVVDPTRLLAELLQDVSVKRAAEIAARVTGLRRNALYAQALAMSVPEKSERTED